MMTADERQNLITFCRDVISIPSLSGDEGRVAERIRDEMQKLGYDEVWTDAFGNVIGRIGPDNGEAPILFDVHMDTIPPVERSKWRHDPWSAVLENDEIHGLGAVDIKGGLAAMVYGVALLAKVKDTLRRPVIMLCTVHEEEAEGAGTHEFLKTLPQKPVASVVCEPTSMQLAIAQRGRAEVRLETFGKAAHSAFPTYGVNAATQMFRLLDRLRDLSMPTHPLLHGASLELTDIKSEPYPSSSVLPERCVATFDRRTLPGETLEDIIGQIESAIDNLSAEDATFQASVDVAMWEAKAYTGAPMSKRKYAPGWETSMDKSLVERALDGLDAAGLPRETTVWFTCSNASTIAADWGIPTVGFGPCDDERAHQANESIKVEDLCTAANVYYQVGLRLALQ